MSRIALLLLLPLAARAEPLPVAWAALDTPTFTAELPGKAELKEGAEKTKVGDVLTATWSLKTSGAFFAISAAVYPPGVMTHAVPAKVLEGARDGAMAKVNAKVEKDFPVFLEATAPRKKYTGREFDGTTTEGIKVAARLFLVGDHLYQLICISPKATFSLPDFKRFADSFKLKPPAAGLKRPKK